MSYYFSCRECNITNIFNNGSDTSIDPMQEYHLIKNIKGGAIRDNESVICSSCISNKTRLKGNHIIINRRTS
jgi:hypothetical protein